jgi:hypothetical protein
MEGALLTMFVCSNHVKDALSLMFVPHIKVISEEENVTFRCHLCKNSAKYKLFHFAHYRRTNQKVI